MKGRQERLYELDLLRFLAALAVVLFHYTFRGNAADDMSTLSFPALSGYSKYGYLGVELFFMISGFVIVLSASGRTVFAFANSRAKRLFPAYWFGVTLTSLCIVAFGDDRYSVTFVQYLQNLPMVGGFWGVTFIDGVYWTLIVELHFYFLVGLMIAAGQFKRVQWFVVAWLAISTLAPYTDYVVTAEKYLISDWAPYFSAGAACFFIKKDGMKPRAVGILRSRMCSRSGRHIGINSPMRLTME